MADWEFLSAVAGQADSGILLDVNNVYVSSRNHGFEPSAHLAGIPRDRVVQFHLAGHSDKGSWLLDSHDAAVPEPVWQLYRGAVSQFGRVPTLVEWDDHIPPLEAGGREPQGRRHRAGGAGVVNLAELQRRFWELATRATDARSAEEYFMSTPQLSADERLEIYANMFVWRQIDALREDFPKLARLLGDEGFYAAAEKYLRAHPSTHPSLGQLGRHFAAHLAETPGPRPDLADLAALEWARCEVFEEAQVRTATAVLVSGPEPAQIVLRTVPALRLLSLRHDVVPLWKELEEGAPPSDPCPKSAAVAVWRKEFVVFHVALAPDEAVALRRAMSGARLGEVCEAFAERPDAVQAALSAVASWFAEEWIAAPEET